MKIEERLGRIEERLDELKKDFENHLQHHFRYNILAWSVALGALVALLVK